MRPETHVPYMRALVCCVLANLGSVRGKCCVSTDFESADTTWPIIARGNIFQFRPPFSLTSLTLIFRVLQQNFGKCRFYYRRI